MKHTEEHYTSFFMDEDDYYIDVVRSYGNGRRFRFSPYAFFLGVFWLLYRKMYLTVFTLFLLGMAETMFMDLLYENYLISDRTYKTIDIISRILWSAGLGFFGNKFYILEANRKISKVLNKNLSEEDTRVQLGKLGGTTLLPHLIIIILTGVLAFLFSQGYIEDVW
ncbi:DUF2628 domain-containing protein [uncultured Aquimarina sp.]|uniref:DUF2628 domain-containing protein n=1 Tax=uncultured Aquimarina sp. TaxID=575652 RepID=UPI002623F734|nr:DUF2628 domain-containing protein [uncultured Aquimarina sp.]